MGGGLEQKSAGLPRADLEGACILAQESPGLPGETLQPSDTFHGSLPQREWLHFLRPLLPNSRFILHKVPAHTTRTVAWPVHSAHAGDTTATTPQALADARNHASKVTHFSSKSPASWDTCQSQANQAGWAPNMPGPGLIAVTQTCSPA